MMKLSLKRMTFDNYYQTKVLLQGPMKELYFIYYDFIRT